jgi:hypothetical protein
MLTKEYRGLSGRILRIPLYHIALSRLVKFRFRGDTLKYFCHDYNVTYLNERTVEIPIILGLLRQYSDRRIIEIGNVLSHYTTIRHDVLDKYEKGTGVINQDILSFEPGEKYDVALCISTLEHIGWDENPEDTLRIYVGGEEPHDVLKSIEPQKLVTAFNRIRSFVHEKGEIIVTFPTGYNPHLDEMISKGILHFDEMYCMKRTSWSNTWKEDTYANVKDLQYNGRYPRANGLIIGIVQAANNT